MKERIHEQISQELKLATRMDLVTVIVALAMTLMLFPLAMVFAASSVGSITGGLTGGLTGEIITMNFNATPTIIMVVCIAAIIVINLFSVRAMLKNKLQRAKLNDGLMKLYKDEGMDQYYDGSIFKSYETRYNLFAVILAAVGATSVIVTLVIFINQLVQL